MRDLCFRPLHRLCKVEGCFYTRETTERKTYWFYSHVFYLPFCKQLCNGHFLISTVAQYLQLQEKYIQELCLNKKWDKTSIFVQ